MDLIPWHYNSQTHGQVGFYGFNNLARSVNLFKPRGDCSWLMDLPYINLLDRHENITTTAVPDAMEVNPSRAKDCFCSNNTHNGTGMFMGISDCDMYMMQFGKSDHRTVDDLYTVTFHAPNHKQSRTLIVKNQTLPGNVTLGNFKDIWWICADKAYIFLPYGWIGCCYMATLKLPYEVLTIQKGQAPDEVASNDIPGEGGEREKRTGTISQFGVLSLENKLRREVGNRTISMVWCDIFGRSH